MGINFSGIDRRGIVGRVLRAPLGLLPTNLTLRVLQGPARGMKWIVGSGTHGYWLGSYEYSKRRRLERMLCPGHVFYDAGANVGFYTLVASALVGPTGHVAAFEPLPRNVEYLRRHIELNRVRNCSVFPLALGERPGRAHFQRARHPAMGSLARSGELEVEVASLDELVSRGVVPEPDVIKLDIEGGELSALRGARSLVASRRPAILLATHGAEIHRECCALLRSSRYSLESLDGRPVEATDELLALPP